MKNNESTNIKWAEFEEKDEKALAPVWDKIKSAQDEYGKRRDRTEAIRRLNEVLSKTGFVERYWTLIKNISKHNQAEDDEWKEDRAELALEEMYAALIRFKPDERGFRGFAGYAYKSFIHTLKISERSYYEASRSEKDKAKIRGRMDRVYGVAQYEAGLRSSREKFVESYDESFDFYPAREGSNEAAFKKMAKVMQKLLHKQKNVVWKVLWDMRLKNALRGKLPSTLGEVKKALREETGDDKWMRKGMEFNIRIHELQLREKLKMLFREEENRE